jgi:hypothetical protein
VCSDHFISGNIFLTFFQIQHVILVFNLIYQCKTCLLQYRILYVYREAC